MNLLCKRALPIVLSAVLVSCASVSVLAAEPKENTRKDENIYANLNFDGSVDQVYVVNQFDLTEPETIVDYGTYTRLKNMTTLEELKETDGAIHIDAPAGKFYYQGYTDRKELPWTFALHYELDGKEVSGEALAGKSGKLRILLSTRPNRTVNNVYYDNFALQISAAFDNEKCTDITARDLDAGTNGTIVNVGGNKQVNFIALPEKEKNYEITADVTNFEMNGISVNGMTLSIAIDNPDTSALLKDIYELQDAAILLDDAAVNLQGGVNELGDAAEQLDSGTKELKNGVEDANAAAKTMNSSVQAAGGNQELSQAMQSFGELLELYGKQQANRPAASAGENHTVSDGDSDEEESHRESGGERDGGNPDVVTRTAAAMVVNTDESSSSESSSSETSSDETSSSETSSTEPQRDQHAIEEGEKMLTTGDIEEVLAIVRGIPINEMDKDLQQKLLESGDPELIDFVANYKAQSYELATARNTVCKLLSGEENEQVFSGAQSGRETGNTEQADSKNVSSEMSYTDLQQAYQTLCTQLTLAAGAQMEELSEGAGALYDGTRTLGGASGTMRDGSKSLNNASGELTDGAVQISDASLELRNQTGDLDTRVDNEVNEMVDAYRYDDYELTSYTSPENTNIRSVQFIIRTPDIDLPEEVVTPEEEKSQMTFVQKIQSLFSGKREV